MSDSDNSLLMDPLQFDMRGSPAMSRRRIGSFNSNGDPSIFRDDTASPGNLSISSFFFSLSVSMLPVIINMYSSDIDITPTGSLRRRRSRVLSEEDDGSLMDFLRSSGHDNVSRERKPSSYGSLGKTNLENSIPGPSLQLVFNVVVFIFKFYSYTFCYRC